MLKFRFDVPEYQQSRDRYVDIRCLLDCISLLNLVLLVFWVSFNRNHWHRRWRYKKRMYQLMTLVAYEKACLFDLMIKEMYIEVIAEASCRHCVKDNMSIFEYQNSVKEEPD